VNTVRNGDDDNDDDDDTNNNLLLVVTITQGTHNYVPETNHVSNVKK
jgi:hypothetical protein